jgi:hypothetical protein
MRYLVVATANAWLSSFLQEASYKTVILLSLAA